MTNNTFIPTKDPSSIEPYFFVWCSEDGTNTGSATDTGELQGETISTYTVTVPSGITKVSDAKTSVTIQGVTYGANTVITVWLSGGTNRSEYDITCQIVTSGGRTLEVTRSLRVVES